jgi:hypothetical protein
MMTRNKSGSPLKSPGKKGGGGGASSVESVPVNFEQLLREQTIELTAKFENTKLDLLSKIAEVKEELLAVIQDNKTEIDSLKSEITVLKTQFHSMAWGQSLWNNTVEQRARGKSIRVHGLKSNKSGVEAIVTAYDFLIAPAFTMAVADGTMTSVPSMRECIEYGHTLKPSPTQPIPSMIIKFRSRLFKHGFLKHKKSVITAFKSKIPDSYAKAVSGPISTDNLRVGNDLTRLNRRAMSALYEFEDTDMVRLAGHRVQFTLKTDTAAEKTWITCNNPYGLNTAEMRNDIPAAVPLEMNPLLI